MRQENKPYSLRLLINLVRHIYTRWRIVPQFDSCGSGLEIIGPQRLELYGPNIHLGNNVHIQTSRGNMSRLCTWQNGKGGFGTIKVGDNALLTPGLQIVSASEVSIGANVMIASRTYITDADWHDVYDRLASPGPTAPVVLHDNVWLGEGVKVCKGVTIGANSVIGAGSVVTQDIPANVIAAGNPAKPVRTLDEARPLTKREAMFSDIKKYNKTMRYLHYLNHKNNNYLSWLWHVIWPNKRS